MTTPDDIFDESKSNIPKLGLSQIPFTESPVDNYDSVDRIFTGREAELKKVFNLFQGRDRRRIYIYGRIGIGKTVFLLEVISVLRRKKPKMLTAYISLPANLDLATAALIALAQAMPNDDWAQRQLYQMGIPTNQIPKEKTTEANVSIGFGAKLSEKDLQFSKSQYPTISFETLLERAQKIYPDGVLIAIDDLDKQNPSVVRQLMHDAQGMLKGKAWFMLTGHPMGMTRDLLTSERGLFDLQLPLEELDQTTTYKMLINYLNSKRINNQCDDPKDPRSVLPFLPETARKFCEVSLGKPRLFNRLGITILNTAEALQAKIITPEVLVKGLKAAELSLRQKAALTAQEERVRTFLQQRGDISDETISMEDLEQLGFRAYNELLPILERLEDSDLAHQLNRDDSKTYAPILLSSTIEG
jgi:hypothetical protein